MEVAAERFLRDGYEGCTLDMVADDAAVSKQLIYENFHDKKDLFAEVVRAELGRIPAREVTAGLPPEDALQDYLHAIITMMAAPRVLGMMRLNVVVWHQFPELAADLHMMRRQMASGLSSYLEVLAAQGVVQPLDASALDVATSLGGVVTEGTRHLFGDRWPPAEEWSGLARWTAKLFFHGDAAGGPSAPAQAHAEEALAFEPVAPPGTMRLAKERFEAFCASALDAFLAAGFEGMSIDTPTKETGVSRATVYRQFGSKQGLFRFVVLQELDAIAAERIAVPDTGDLFSDLQVLARETLALHLTQRSIALHHLLIREAARAPDLARRFYDLQWLRVHAPLTTIYRRHRGVEPCVRTTRAFHTLSTFGIRFLVSPGPADDAECDAIARRTARTMARGFAAP